MSFRQNKETNRKWNTFHQANKELIEEIGLPGPTIDTWDRFADLLMHGIIDHHDDPTNFDLDELSPEKLKLFRVLVDRYFEAGFSNPGMHPVIVGGQIAFLKLVRKYPKGFSWQVQKDAEDVLSVVTEEWWLDTSYLPNQLVWARVTIYGDNSADVLDYYGEVHEFRSNQNKEDAEHWLSKGHYSPVSALIEAGELPVTTVPPTASSDTELVPRMVEYVDGDA